MLVSDTLLLYMFMFIAAFLGVAMIVFQNPINAVLSFITIFIISACFMLYIGVEFLPIIYLLVYIGAVAVLFLFIIMLLNVYTKYVAFTFNVWIALGVLAVGYWLIHFYARFKTVLISGHLEQASVCRNFETLLPLHSTTRTSFNVVDALDLRALDINFTLLQEETWIRTNDIHTFGSVLYTIYAPLFVIVTVILLVALIGVIVLTLHREYEK